MNTLRTRDAGLTWFEVALQLFAIALPLGVIVVVVAPVDFLHALGALIVGTALIGLWVAALGLQLEHPERWHALKGSLRRLTMAPSPSRSIADER